MKRLYAWLAGLAGGAAAYRAFRRRPPEPAVPESDPAEALRAKLAQSKETHSKETQSKEAESRDTAADAAEPEREPRLEAEPEPADVADRRASVHEQARAVIDEMNASE